MLMVLWIWAMLFMSCGPRAVQERYHYVPQILLIILVLPIVVRRIAEGKSLTLPREVAIYALWVTWCLMGLLVATHPSALWESVGTLLKLGGTFLLMAWVVDSRKRLNALILLGFVGGMILVFFSPALGTGEIYMREHEFGGRETGATGNPNTLSYLAVIAFTGLLFAVASARTKPFKIILTLVMAIPIYAAFKTGSRNAWAGIFTAIVLLYFCYFRTRFRGKLATKFILFTIIFGVIAGGTYLLLSFGQFAYRYESLIEFITTGQTGRFATEGRVVMFMGELRMTAQNPVLGVGAGHDFIHLQKYTQMPGVIHSDLAGLGGVIGIPGFLLFYAIPISLALRIRRLISHPLATPEERKILSFCLILLLGNLLRTVHSSVYRSKFTWTIWGGILGYATSLQSELQAREAAGLLEQWEEPALVSEEGSEPLVTGPLR